METSALSYVTGDRKHHRPDFVLLFDSKQVVKDLSLVVLTIKNSCQLCVTIICYYIAVKTVLLAA